MSYITGTQTELLYSLSASVTKNTYTTQAVMSAVAGTTPVCSVDPRFFREAPNPVSRALLVKAEGTIGSVSSPTFALALGWDTTVNSIANSITVMAATTTSATTVPFHFEALYTCTAYATSTMTLQVNGYFKMEAVASGGVASASALSVGFSGTVSAVDPRVLSYIELFGTWSVSSASNSTILQQMWLFGLN
jgi:hypothetical protein